jgi:hypothetical protein
LITRGLLYWELQRRAPNLAGSKTLEMAKLPNAIAAMFKDTPDEFIQAYRIETATPSHLTVTR